MEAQATLWANRRTRLEVARAMYRLRFPDEDSAGLNRQELLGHEGRRVKDCYRLQAKRTGVPWRGRHYAPGGFTAGDAPNQAVTAAAQCMYGIAHAVVAAMGCSPGLGFVHFGHELSFVVDVADLYKTEIGIPVAFDVAAEGGADMGSRTRRALRSRINRARLLDRCVDDIKVLLLVKEPGAQTQSDPSEDMDQVLLRSDRDVTVPAGCNYAEEVTW